MAYTVQVLCQATYRLVPEDERAGAGINVPWRLSDMTGEVGVASRVVPLRAGGRAIYVDGTLYQIEVPDRWRLEQWPVGAQTDDTLLRRILRELDQR